LSYKLPANLGGRLPTDVSVGPGDYLSHLDFAAAFAADARNGPFSLLTDFMHTRFSRLPDLETTAQLSVAREARPPDIWNGIGGIRGRIRLGNTPLFIPYYFDIGAGGSQLTWQIASGLGNQTRWGALSATYRYLSFEQGAMRSCGT
jgi:hypothetical protein